MKKFLGIVILGLLFNFYISVQAQDSPRNYLKGEFYNSVKNYFLVAKENNNKKEFHISLQGHALQCFQHKGCFS